MTLESIPTVRVGRVDRDATQKYLVIELTAPYDEKKIVIWAVAEPAGSTVKTARIVDEIRALLPDTAFQITPLGGGILLPRPVSRKLLVTSNSSLYGDDPDRQRTIEMLKEHLPQFERVFDPNA